MPVPVPRFSKPRAHPVIKTTTSGTDQLNPPVFHQLSSTLPVSPVGPPPSFGTREQWINSLPSWRRTKPRRIWEDDARLVEQLRERDCFQQGLTVADNASVIKGARAQACIPPLHTLLDSSRSVGSSAQYAQGCDDDADDEMSPVGSDGDQGQFDGQSQWSATSPFGSDEMDVEYHSRLDNSPADWECGEHTYERGAFTPVFEDQSPGTNSGRDPISSPLEPVTPFGDFVDRAVAAANQPHHAVYENAIMEESQFNQACGPECYQTQQEYQLVPENTRNPTPAPELVVTPSATPSYKKLAEPLSEWVANYVWKVCTTGLSLPSMFSPITSPINQYATSPPSYLAASVHSLLLSTLLQPSAVFLALWYIVRLPVYFGANGLGNDRVKELRFRVALLGDARGGLDRSSMEESAPFRLIVLGCMLANKWLDDHTFSNKTWHTISNVPIASLNKLESLALDIFSHSLSISTHDWSQWLTHVMSYHVSLTSPSHPQPISRPSANPHSIVRKAIDEIIQAPAACHSVSSPHSEPVFLGLEERRLEKLEKEHAADALDIDLDVDGPLREEYLPKRRRMSGASSNWSNPSEGKYAAATRAALEKMHDWERREMEKPLPPPAKWSPAGDEPILRDRNRVSGHYVAVQPPPAPTTAPYAFPPRYPDTVYPTQNWNTPVGYGYDMPSQHSIQAPFSRYPFIVPVSMSHSRSQSLSYDQDNTQGRHLRSYSQSRFEYQCSDIRMTANELAPSAQVDAPQWASTAHYAYPATAFAPHTSVNYQSAWLRT